MTYHALVSSVFARVGLAPEQTRITGQPFGDERLSGTKDLNG